MRHYIRLVAIGVGLLGWTGTASAWHPWHHHHHHHPRVVVVTTPVTTTTTTTTANVVSQPVYVQPVTLQPVYVTQPATTTTTTANVISQPVYVQPVYVQPAQAEKPQAAQVEKVCPQQELRIRVFVEGGSGAKVEAVKVQPATVAVDKELLKSVLAAAEANQKANDALIKALQAAIK